jgi:uncharacterized protein YecE (DUF72 family)
VVTVARILIGTSGWSYPHWDGVLYRPGLPPAARLARYCEVFDTVELNASYYRWPPVARFARWRRVLPDGFVMSVKAPRGLTHARKLHQPEPWIERIAAGWHELGERRGVLLVQTAASFPRDDARLDWFLERLPDWIPAALELRHPSWQVEEVFQLLERQGAGYCVLSGANLPCVLRATAGFVYVRLHGPDPDHLYGGSYNDDDLRWWADRIREWEGSGHDVHAFFNNDGDGNAVRNAWTLRSFLGV